MRIIKDLNKFANEVYLRNSDKEELFESINKFKQLCVDLECDIFVINSFLEKCIRKASLNDTAMFENLSVISRYMTKFIKYLEE